jgi:hypothetical protein
MSSAETSTFFSACQSLSISAVRLIDTQPIETLDSVNTLYHDITDKVGLHSICSFHQRFLNLFSYLCWPLLQLYIIVELLVNVQLNVTVDLCTLDANLACDQGLQSFFNIHFLSTRGKYMYPSLFPTPDLPNQLQGFLPLSAFT